MTPRALAAVCVVLACTACDARRPAAAKTEDLPPVHASAVSPAVDENAGAIDPRNLAATAEATFSDDFDTLDLWDGTKGVWSTDAWYNDERGPEKSKGSTRENNGEQQWFINANYPGTKAIRPWTVADGILTITGDATPPDIRRTIKGYKYVSGEINTFRSFHQTYGYFEMRAKLPAGRGLWPAFWLMPRDGSWPPELDIMEVLGHDMTKLYMTLHSQASGEHKADTGEAVVADMSEGFHTYGLHWRKDKITWYFDGRAVLVADTPADFHKPMYVIANLAMGGHWPGKVDASTPLPAKMQIDYIRVYKGRPKDTPKP